MAIEVISRGEGQDGRPHLLFIHGAFHDARCWDHHYLPFFARHGWAAHALSLRGHGESPGDVLTDRPGLDAYAADVRDVVMSLGGDVVLIGHSMGGVLAQIVRSQLPQVAGTVLLASSPLRAPLSVILRILGRYPLALMRVQVFGDTIAGLPAYRSFFYGRDLPQEDRDRYEAELCPESPFVLKETFKRPPPRTPDLETRPVLVVAGEDDWSIPMKNNRWLARVFKAPLETVPGAHCLMVDPNWEAGARVIEAWLCSRFGPGAGNAPPDA